tara:strand:+ start:103 stop:639 length:537 start_codon:yes stop_codon:yes gene_type:complete
MTDSPFADGGFDYKAFVDEGFDAQTKYAEKVGEHWTPNELKRVDTLVELAETKQMPFVAPAYKARFEKIIEHFGHLTEESIEARVYVPRRSWKNEEPSYMDSPEMREEFVAEMFDILLFHRAILAYAGVDGEEFARIAAKKMKYNAVRPDHNVNGTVAAESNPAAELQGDCPSAEFNQ